MERRAGGCAPGAAFLKLENTPPPPCPSRPLSPPRPRDVSRAPAPPPAGGQREAGTGGHRRAPAAPPHRPPLRGAPAAARPPARPAPAPPPPAGLPAACGSRVPPSGERAARRATRLYLITFSRGQGEVSNPRRTPPPTSGMPRPGPRRGRDTPAGAGAPPRGLPRGAAPSPVPRGPRSPFGRLCPTAGGRGSDFPVRIGRRRAERWGERIWCM
ncbi:unnamed protein product, partial [Bubo scandiacus]